MARIATRFDAYAILGGGPEAIATSEKCVTRNWLMGNFNGIIDNQKLARYTDNQLVDTADIVSTQDTWRVQLTSDFKDTWGNSPLHITNVTMKDGVTRFHGGSSTTSYLRYNIGDLLKKATSAVLKFEVNIATLLQNLWGASIICDGTSPSLDKDVWWNIGINTQHNDSLQWAATWGNYEPLPLNVWHEISVLADFATNEALLFVNGEHVATTTRGETLARPTEIMLGGPTPDSLNGWIREASIYVG